MVKSSNIYRFLFFDRHVTAFEILDFSLISAYFVIACHRRRPTFRKCPRVRWYSKYPVLYFLEFSVLKTISIFLILFGDSCRPRNTYHSFPETLSDTLKPIWRAINVIVNKADNISARTTQTFVSEFGKVAFFGEEDDFEVFEGLFAEGFEGVI